MFKVAESLCHFLTVLRLCRIDKRSDSLGLGIRVSTGPF